MKKIELLNDGKNTIYLKIRTLDDLSEELKNDILTNTDKPYIAFNFGVIVNMKSWVGFDTIFSGEDGFVLCGEECKNLENSLRMLLDSYNETELSFNDCLGDTDARVDIKCEKNKVVVSGSLGASYTWESGINAPVFKFSIDATSEFLSKFYNALRDNMLH